MIPNNQPDADTRFRRLVEAIKFVYASTFFRRRQELHPRRSDRTSGDEKMAVIIQEVVGRSPRRPLLSRRLGRGPLLQLLSRGQGADPRTAWSTWPWVWARPIVDGGVAGSTRPPGPTAPPPFGSMRERCCSDRRLDFWAVNMGKPPRLRSDRARPSTWCKADLAGGGLRRHARPARLDLRRAAGTGCARAPGVDGPRVLDFAPLLRLRRRCRSTTLIRELLAARRASARRGGRDRVRGDPARHRARRARASASCRCGRCWSPRRRSRSTTRSSTGAGPAARLRPGAWATAAARRSATSSTSSPRRFEARLTPAIAAGARAAATARLLEEGRPYLLIGFGRWGSSDPWLGIPVEWGQIARRPGDRRGDAARHGRRSRARAPTSSTTSSASRSATSASGTSTARARAAASTGTGSTASRPSPRPSSSGTCVSTSRCGSRSTAATAGAWWRLAPMRSAKREPAMTLRKTTDPSSLSSRSRSAPRS